MTAAQRQVIRTYADGMGLAFKDVLVPFLKLGRAGRGRALVQMRQLERAWQDEMQIRAQPRWWQRLWMRIVTKVRRAQR